MLSPLMSDDDRLVSDADPLMSHDDPLMSEVDPWMSGNKSARVGVACAHMLLIGARTGVGAVAQFKLK